MRTGLSLKMEREAKRIETISQKYLPNSPYHLSDSTTRRYPSPVGVWFDGPSSRLQYMTYLSDADRGILFTRASFDILVDPSTPAQSSALNATPKGESKKAVNKIAFKDYQRKKTFSMSPAGAEAAVKPEGRLESRVDASEQRRTAIAKGQAAVNISASRLGKTVENGHTVARNTDMYAEEIVQNA
jgi:hypothetical protein